MGFASIPRLLEYSQYPTESKSINKFVAVEEKELISALSEQDSKAAIKEGKKNYQNLQNGNPDTPLKNVPQFIEAAIRDNFDRFLDYLQQIEVMRESKIIDEHDLDTYLEPWVEIIDKLKDTTRVVLFGYMGLVENEDSLTGIQKSIGKLFKGKIEFVEAEQVRQAYSKIFCVKQASQTNKQVYSETEIIHMYDTIN